MLGLFKSKEQKSTEKFWKSEIGQRVTAHNEQYFGPGGVWEGFSREGQQQLCGWLLQRIFGVYEAADTFSAMRLELAAMASCHAEKVILLRDPVDPVNDCNRTRYVSGELHLHIRSCAAHCKELAEELWRSPDASDADLYLYAQQRSIYYNYVLNGINLLRYDFDDFAGGKDRDWLRPFSKSMMIWHEHVYRSNIGLPTLFEDKSIGIKALEHSVYFNLVRDGTRNPLFEWETKFGSHEVACGEANNKEIIQLIDAALGLTVHSSTARDLGRFKKQLSSGFIEPHDRRYVIALCKRLLSHSS
jgi:hypothetical protein